eukprot:TRINITY_DN743_c0_g1_i3.p1 TRINITY_DN743_c0_g1~~TRINITY_DN743_c0_g1_i3.p1  ORF type:complete len:434 (-),score=51.99 TRINITY_DN743_c0_g1_i3:159-1460(-)
MFVWVLVVAVVALFLVWDFRRKNVGALSNGPTSWPLVGSVPSVLKHVKYIHNFHYDCLAKYGDTYRLWGLGPLPSYTIITSNPENAKHFLTTNFENYERNNDVWRFGKLFGQGIFASNGVQWQFHRRTARPLFTKVSVAEMLPHFVNHGQKVIKILGDAATSKQTIDLQDLIFRFTLDSICTIGFGHNINSLDKPVPFSEAFNRSQKTISMNAKNPFLRHLPDKQFDADYELMSDQVLTIVRSRQEKNDYHDRTDLLSRFMNMRDDDGKPFSEEYLRDMVLNFFIAGRDTTAVLMSWTMYLLSQNPEVETKLVGLIEEIVGEQPPTVEQLTDHRMDYLQWVLDETLRLYPSVPYDIRRAVKADVFPDGAVVPAQALVVYSAFLMGRSEQWWPEASRFWPERWADKSTCNKNAFLAFHAGPQTCLGRPMVCVVC